MFIHFGEILHTLEYIWGTLCDKHALCFNGINNYYYLEA